MVHTENSGVWRQLRYVQNSGTVRIHRECCLEFYVSLAHVHGVGREARSDTFIRFRMSNATGYGLFNELT